MSSPLMFPNNRNVRDSGRDIWLIISMGSIKGVNHHTGPINCLKYFNPCSLTPTTWVDKKTTIAMAAFVLIFEVGDSKPGTMPMRLDVRINSPNVAIRGKNFLPLCPMISLSRASNPPRTTSMTFCVFPG